eukprot:TCONS_00067254-protein
MSQYKVHRVRFIQHKPKATISAALDVNCNPPRLAVSLDDGSIEIRDPSNHFMVDITIPGQNGRTAEHLAWNNGRLFSGGLNGQIIEWDLKNLVPKYSENSCGGPVWCLKFNHKKNLLAAGCEDGSVRIFKLMSHGLNYERSLHKQESRILSLAWSKDDANLVTGGFESTIRIYNFESGQIVSRITTDGKGDENTMVWAVEVMDDFTVVTGDSKGCTQFWDGHTGTLLTSFKSHEADVLTLAPCYEEVYSSGVDGKVVQFNSRLVDNEKKWTMNKHIQLTDYDIRALVCFKNPQTDRNFVIAAGVDPYLYAVPTNKLTIAKMKKYFNTPTDVCQVAPDANQLLYRSNNKLNLWQLESNQDLSLKESKQLLEINCDGDDHIFCSALSACGKYVCYSTIGKSRLFEIEQSPLKLNKIYRSLPPLSKIAFTPDSRYMVGVTFAKKLHLVDFQNENEFELSISKIKISLPYRFLKVANDNETIGLVDAESNIFIFRISESGLEYASQVPSVSDKISSFTFHPQSSRIMLSTSAKDVFEFDYKEGKFTTWLFDLNDAGIFKKLSRDHHLLNQVCVNPVNPSEIFVQAFNEFGKLLENATVDIQSEETEDQPDTKKAKKSMNNPLKTINSFKKLLHFSFNNQGEMITVEIPQSFKEMLPLPLKRKRYQK